MAIHYICVTCGAQFAAMERPPSACLICEDERQYVGWNGQQCTALDALRENHRNILKPEGSGVTGIGTEPGFAIGQRALLVQTAAGNVLWDCVSLIDDATIRAVRDLGGIAAIAISHPHFYSSMVEWSRAFDAPIYLHTAERPWIMRPDPAIVFWEGETYSIGEGVMLVRCGGHFEGAQVLHWAAGAEGRGALFTSDIIRVCFDRRYVSFMYSYPNLIPMPARAVRRIVKAVEPLRYDCIYGGWWGHNVPHAARAAVARSAERYLKAIGAAAT